MKGNPPGVGHMPRFVLGGHKLRRKRCEEILGRPVYSAATHEGDPNLVRCYIWIKGKYHKKPYYNMDLVNLEKGIFREYMRDGKLVEDIQWFKLG